MSRRPHARALRLALEPSSNRSVIDAVFELADIASAFEVTVSPEEVAHGEPAPDVVVDAVRRLEFHGTSVSRSRTRETGSTPHLPPVCG